MEMEMDGKKRRHDRVTDAGATAKRWQETKIGETVE